MINFFTQRDFDTASPPCLIGEMDAAFMDRLNVARFHAGVPFVVNSAFRTKEHERKQNRDGTSSHTKGIAVDLKAENSKDRYAIIAGLIKAGFTRIGIGKNFIHVDADTEKVQHVIWHYYKN